MIETEAEGVTPSSTEEVETIEGHPFSEETTVTTETMTDTVEIMIETEIETEEETRFSEEEAAAPVEATAQKSN